jgi:hypothetical protein
MIKRCAAYLTIVAVTLSTSTSLRTLRSSTVCDYAGALP